MSANEIPLCKVTVAKEKNILIGDQLQMLLQFCKYRCWTFASRVGPYWLHTSYVKIHTSDVFIILCYLLRSHCGIWFRIVLLYCIAYWKDCTSVSLQLEQASLKKSCACTPLGQHMSMFLVSNAFLICFLVLLTSVSSCGNLLSRKLSSTLSSVNELLLQCNHSSS